MSEAVRVEVERRGGRWLVLLRWDGREVECDHVHPTLDGASACAERWRRRLASGEEAQS